MGANKKEILVTFDYHLQSSKGGEHTIEVQASVELGQKAERGESGAVVESYTQSIVTAWTMFWKDGKGAFVKMLNPDCLPPGMTMELEEAAISAAYDLEKFS